MTKYSDGVNTGRGAPSDSREMLGVIARKNAEQEAQLQDAMKHRAWNSASLPQRSWPDDQPVMQFKVKGGLPKEWADDVFYGPYKSLSDIADLPGIYLIGVPKGDEFYLIGCGYRLGESMRESVAALVNHFESEWGINLGTDFVIGVGYPRPELGLPYTKRSCDRFMKIWGAGFYDYRDLF